MIRRRDDGLILPLVLVIVVILGAVIVAVATYASSTLRYGQVVESSADRLAATQGAVDNALEALDRSASLCALTTLANAGYEYDLLQPTSAVPTINGLNPRVRCRTLGGAITGVEDFALVLTADPGTGSRDGAILNIDGSATPRKVIDGPVFMALRPRQSDTVSLGAPLTIQNGDLWYGRPTCPATDVSVPMFPTGVDNLLITPQGYGIRCVATPDWQTLFQAARPSESAVSSLADAPLPSVDGSGCTVFSPGRYTTAPALADYNYFQSGDYYFENIGEWTIEGSYALFGWPGSTGPSIPGQGNDTIAKNSCVGAWESDADQSGATVYLGGDSHITVNSNGALEISGRDQGGQLVGLQALEAAGLPSTIQGDRPLGPSGPITRLVEINSGEHKQLSIQALVWAPYGSFEFDNVSNEAVAALTGGAVVSEIFLQAPASATNFVVTNGHTAADRRLEITATAVSPNGGTTKVQAIVLYRDGDYALESRRVMCTTPDDPDPSAC
jgi:hypothetical protein